MRDDFAEQRTDAAWQAHLDGDDTRRALLWAVAPARADSDDAPSRTQKPQSRAPSVNAAEVTGADEVDGPTIFEGVPGLGPVDHARDVLRDAYGVYLHGNYFGDPYADIGGGMRRGAAYAGRLDLQVDVDAEKIFGAKDLTLHANMYAIQGPRPVEELHRQCAFDERYRGVADLEAV